MLWCEGGSWGAYVSVEIVGFPSYVFIEFPAGDGDKSVCIQVATVREIDSAALSETRYVLAMDRHLAGAKIIMNVGWVVMDSYSCVPKEAVTVHVN